MKEGEKGMAAKLTKKQNELLKAIKAGTATESGSLTVDQSDDLKALVDAGHVEVNPESAADGKIQARTKGAAPMTETNEVATPNGASNGAYQLISGIPLAAPKKGGKKAEEYPFSKMEVGDSFLVPATDRYPKPWETFASTVSSATRRFSVKSEETRKNRKGEDIPVLKPTKKFTLRQVQAGQTYEGSTFVEPATGARVFRIA